MLQIKLKPLMHYPIYYRSVSKNPSLDCLHYMNLIFFLRFRRRLPVRGSGSCRDLSIFLSVAHSFLMFQAFRSLLTVSFHLNFGLPLGRFPSIFISTTALMFSVVSLLLAYPDHSNVLLLLTITVEGLASRTVSGRKTFAINRNAENLICEELIIAI